MTNRSRTTAEAKGGSRVGERGAKEWGLGRGEFFEFLSRNGAFLCILLMTGACPLDPPLAEAAVTRLSPSLWFLSAP